MASHAVFKPNGTSSHLARLAAVDRNYIAAHAEGTAPPPKRETVIDVAASKAMDLDFRVTEKRSSNKVLDTLKGTSNNAGFDA
jgi:hypothetical protein